MFIVKKDCEKLRKTKKSPLEGTHAPTSQRQSFLFRDSHLCPMQKHKIKIRFPKKFVFSDKTTIFATLTRQNVNFTNTKY
jgi:hypothetical protein